MFKSFEEEKIFRFKEFDEAREFIENFRDNKDTFEAIDYMINHKEYYFLLKNIINQLNTKKSILAYLFFNLPCLKREEDLELIIQILKKADNILKKIVIDYVKSCNNEEFAKIIFESGLKEEAIEIFKKFPNLEKYLKKKLLNEKDIKVLKKAIEFFEIYDEKYIEKLKEKIANK
ncbi:hypothetical protein [Nautilia lithotrophica]